MTARKTPPEALRDLAAELVKLRTDPERWAEIQRRAAEIKEGKRNV